MGRVVDFAKRRIAGYIVFWASVLLILYALYRGEQPTQSAAVVVLAVAAVASFLYTRRMKRKQRAARIQAGR